MRLLRYPANDAPMDEINMGISAHTDFECFTLMYQSAPGLQVKNVRNEWVQLPARPARWMVILGDMLERWSNGYLKATAHRVVNTSWERLSLVMFCAVDGDTVVQPLPEFVSAASPSRYEPVTQGKHLDQQVDAAVQRKAPPP
jgi:isopenicillin N synthase-like dioxygenase